MRSTLTSLLGVHPTTAKQAGVRAALAGTKDFFGRLELSQKYLAQSYTNPALREELIAGLSEVSPGILQHLQRKGELGLHAATSGQATFQKAVQRVASSPPKPRNMFSFSPEQLARERAKQRAMKID